MPMIPFTRNRAVVVDRWAHLITFQSKARFTGPGAGASDKFGENEKPEETNKGERAEECSLDGVDGASGEEIVCRGLGTANLSPLFVTCDGRVMQAKDEYPTLR